MVQLLQPSFSKGEVTPELFGRVDAASYKSGLATARNTVVRTWGGIVNRAGLKFVGLCTSNTVPPRLRRFRYNTTDTYMLEFGGGTMRVIRNDAFVTEAPLTITNVSLGTPAVVTTSVAHGFSAGDAVQIDGTMIGPTRLSNRRFTAGLVLSSTTFTLSDMITGAGVTSFGMPAYVSGGHVSRLFTLATPYAAADLRQLKFVQSANVLTITHPLYDERRLTRTSDTAWTLTVPAFTPLTATVTGVAAVVTGTPGTTSVTYVVTAIDATSGEESLPSTPFTLATSNATINNTVSWSAGTNVVLYSVYRAVNGVFGFIGDTPLLTFLDANFSPVLSTTPPLARNPFAGAGNRPGCSTYVQQRQVRGGQLNLPDTAYFSRTGNFYNMTVSQPSSPDDAITATLAAKEVNEIRHFVPMQDLLAFTSGNEYRISTNGQGLTAANLDFMPQSAWGCSHLEPIVIGLTCLFVPENQLSVRSARYTYLSNSYTGEEVSLLSNHFFDNNNQMIAWAFGRIPDPLILSVRLDGSAACLTYQEEQQVTAWTRWDTSGLFLDVDIVRPNLSAQNLDEVPYFVVQRIINGQVVQMVERLHSRRFADLRDAFFLDAGLSYDQPFEITSIGLSNPVSVGCAGGHPFAAGQIVDIYDIKWVPNFDAMDNETQPAQLNTSRFQITNVTPTAFQLLNLDGSNVNGTLFNGYLSGGTVRAAVSTVTGLDHLEGRAVMALADGNVVDLLTVLNGSVTIPFLASRIHVGLKYISDVGTLSLDTQPSQLTGRAKMIPSVTLRLNRTRGIILGRSIADLVEMKFRDQELYGDPTALFTGDEQVVVGANWELAGAIFIRQRFPLPMEILDITPNDVVED